MTTDDIAAEIAAEREQLDAIWHGEYSYWAVRDAILNAMIADNSAEPRSQRFGFLIVAALAVAGLAVLDRSRTGGRPGGEGA